MWIIYPCTVRDNSLYDWVLISNTIGGWVAAAGDLLTPLYGRLIFRVQQINYIQTDETPIKVLDKKESSPVMKRLKKWLMENAPMKGGKVLPLNKIGKAISYTLNMWYRLVRYLEDMKLTTIGWRIAFVR